MRLGAKGTSRLLSASVVPADEAVAAALGLVEGDDVNRIRRLRLGDDEPMGVQTAHVRIDRAPDLHIADDDDASLYERLRTVYGITPREAVEVYRVGSAAPEDAEILAIAPGTPVFIVERTTHDHEGAYEFTVSTMRGDKYEIRSTLRTF